MYKKHQKKTVLLLKHFHWILSGYRMLFRQKKYGHPINCWKELLMLNTPILETKLFFHSDGCALPAHLTNVAVALSKPSLYYSEITRISPWIALHLNVWLESHSFCKFICQLLQYNVTYLITHICRFPFHQERSINNCSALPCWDLSIKACHQHSLFQEYKLEYTAYPSARIL